MLEVAGRQRALALQPARFAENLVKQLELPGTTAGLVAHPDLLNQLLDSLHTATSLACALLAAPPACPGATSPCEGDAPAVEVSARAGQTDPADEAVVLPPPGVSCPAGVTVERALSAPEPTTPSSPSSIELPVLALPSLEVTEYPHLGDDYDCQVREQYVQCGLTPEPMVRLGPAGVQVIGYQLEGDEATVAVVQERMANPHSRKVNGIYDVANDWRTKRAARHAGVRNKKRRR